MNNRRIHLGAIALSFLLSALACERPAADARGAEVIRVASAVAVNPGFSSQTVVSGLVGPTAMAFAPDGRLFVCQQTGSLAVVKNGTLLGAPFLTVQVDSSGERGLLGVAFGPAFSSNGFVYVYYTAPTANVHNRVSRFTASGDVAVANSEAVVLELDNLGGATFHNGGALHFGKDGKLYVAVGENVNGANAQTLANMLGKLLRINPDGTIPTDNPFFFSASGNNRSIWALGLRNPFTFDIQPGTGRIFIDDVGQGSWEEIDDGIAGANYGWPTTEGATTDPRFRGPLHAYDHSAGCAITGGAFYNPGTVQLGASLVGSYFFADYCGGWIRGLAPGTGAVSGFATGLSSPVDLKVGVDGMLYYLERGAGSVGRIFATTTNQPPSITTQPSDQSVALGQPATFSVGVNGSQPLAYQWQRGATPISGATGSSYTMPSASAADNGAGFRVVVSNAFGTATSNNATLAVTNNTAPAATITAPAVGTTYKAGDTIVYAGTATDAEDGALPASAFTWQIDFHHATHLHPFMPPTSGVKGGSFLIPTSGETAANVYYRILLTVTDASGLTTTTFRDVLPQTAQITLQSTPPGFQVTLDGQPLATPVTITGVVGMSRVLGAVSPQISGGTSYTFGSWSDGGAATHAISSPAVDTAYTAVYDPGFAVKVNFQPGGVTIPPGFLADAGAAFGDRGNGFTYGWNGDNTAQTRDRDSPASPDQRYDTLIHTQRAPLTNATWELQIPPGQYQVRLVAGDAWYTDSLLQTDVEGVRVLDGAPSAGAHWLDQTRTVTVGDGRLTVSNGPAAANNKLCFIEVTQVGSGGTNTAPAATITAPSSGATYKAGDTIAYAGTGSDAEDGGLPAGAFTWQIDFHHAGLVDPFMPPTSGAAGGSFTIPNTGVTSANVFYRVLLSVRDSAGLTGATFRDVTPQTARIALATNPAGLQVTLDGQALTTPVTITSVVGMNRALGVVSPQTNGSGSYLFSSWSDGGSATHTIGTPAVDTTYTASYQAGGSGLVVAVNFQPAGVPVPPGTLPDNGAVFGARGNGQSYGWNGDNAAQARDRDSPASPDQRYDTLIHLQKPALPDALWELQVPPGKYQVRIVAGDAAFTDSVFALDAEGVRVVTGTPDAAARWLEGTQTVTVSDGRLTVRSGAGAANNKICFIEVTQVP